MAGPNVVTQVNEQFSSGKQSGRISMDIKKVAENQGFLETDTAPPKSSNLYIKVGDEWIPVGTAANKSPVFMKFSGRSESDESGIPTVYLADSLVNLTVPGLSSKDPIGYTALTSTTQVSVAVKPVSNTTDVDMVIDILVDGSPVATVNITAGSTAPIAASVFDAVVSVDQLIDVRVSPSDAGTGILQVAVTTLFF